MKASVWKGAGRRIYLQEVGTRDGLHVEDAFVPTRDKIALVNALSRAGMAKIEVTAFVSPKAIPALRDAERVLREIDRLPGVVYSALVPNVRGAARALDARADELNLVISASESHNLANLHMTRAQSFAALGDVNDIATDAKTAVNISLSCSFGCPIEGGVPESTALDRPQKRKCVGIFYSRPSVHHLSPCELHRHQRHVDIGGQHEGMMTVHRRETFQENLQGTCSGDEWVEHGELSRA